MDIGLILLPEPGGAAFVARARRATDLGFSKIGVGDVPGPDGELFVALGLLAASGLQASIGPMVTNPVSRHPAVTAAAITAVDRANSHGAFLGLGRGGSPLASLGLARPSTQELASGCSAIRAALSRLGSAVPILLSAYGPRTLHIAGELADGVTIAGGTSLEYLRTAVASVRNAATSAGRDPDSVDLTVLARVSIAATRAEAVRDIRANLASAGANNLRAAADLAGVPTQIRASLLELRRRYESRPEAHVSSGSPNADLIDELGLTDFLADRFAIAGTADEVRTRLGEYRELGISTLWAPAVDASPDELIDRLAGCLPAVAAEAGQPGAAGDV